MTDTSGDGMIHVPRTAADLKPPRPANLTVETANFLRAHWDEVAGFFLAISGEAPSIHGNITFDEAACIFKIQEMARENGYALLGGVQASKLRRVVRSAHKQVTGHAVKALEAQNRNMKRIAARPRIGA